MGEGDRAAAYTMAQTRKTFTDQKDIALANHVTQGIAAIVNHFRYDLGCSHEDVANGLSKCSREFFETCAKKDPDFVRKYRELEENAERKLRAAEAKATFEKTREWVEGTVSEKRSVRKKAKAKQVEGVF